MKVVINIMEGIVMKVVRGEKIPECKNAGCINKVRLTDNATEAGNLIKFDDMCGSCRIQATSELHGVTPKKLIYDRQKQTRRNRLLAGGDQMCADLACLFTTDPDTVSLDFDVDQFAVAIAKLFNENQDFRQKVEKHLAETMGV